MSAAPQGQSLEYMLGKIEGILSSVLEEMKGIRDNHSKHDVQIDAQAEKISALGFEIAKLNFRLKVYATIGSLLATLAGFGIHELLAFYK